MTVPRRRRSLRTGAGSEDHVARARHGAFSLDDEEFARLYVRQAGAGTRDRRVDETTDHPGPLEVDAPNVVSMGAPRAVEHPGGQVSPTGWQVAGAVGGSGGRAGTGAKTGHEGSAGTSNAGGSAERSGNVRRWREFSGWPCPSAAAPTQATVVSAARDQTATLGWTRCRSGSSADGVISQRGTPCNRPPPSKAATTGNEERMSPGSGAAPRTR